MNPLQIKWESRLLEHRFCAEIVADFTTRMETNVSGLNDAKFQVKTLLQSIYASLPLSRWSFLSPMASAIKT